jgi:hypothetical protein
MHMKKHQLTLSCLLLRNLIGETLCPTERFCSLHTKKEKHMIFNLGFPLFKRKCNRAMIDTMVKEGEIVPSEVSTKLLQ